MPLTEGFTKDNSPGLAGPNFCPVNVLNHVVQLLLSFPSRFPATTFTFDKSTPAVLSGISHFDRKDVNRANHVFRYWHHRQGGGRAKKPGTSNHAWAIQAVFRMGVLKDRAQRATRTGPQMLELKRQRERLAYLLPADSRL